MSEECTHDCSNCSAACSSRDAAPQHDAPNPHSRVKKVIGVVSGKGGVGKSMTSALLACAMARRGYHCGILDADITGPSIPKLFGIHGRAMADEKGCWPIQSRMGIDVMSINLLVENEEDPVVWRGPVIAGAVKQFWTDVVWKDVDFLFVDMPPGTGDAHCLSFVKRFSKLFSKFFVTFSLSLCPHLECLSIISPSPAKVNTFLKSFFHSLLMSYIFNSFSTIHSNMHCCTHFFTLFYLLYSRFFTNN